MATGHFRSACVLTNSDVGLLTMTMIVKLNRSHGSGIAFLCLVPVFMRTWQHLVDRELSIRFFAAALVCKHADVIVNSAV